MKSVVVLLGFLFIFHGSTNAQEYDRFQGFKVGVTPSALLNRWIGYQGKVEYSYKQFAIEVNYGYLKGTELNEPYSGYRFRPVLKYYYRQSDIGWHYFGLGALRRKLDIDANGNFGRFNNSFFQSLDFKLTQRLTGFYLMSGTLIPLGNDRFFADIGIGLGRGILNVEHFGVPEDAELFYDPPLFTYDARTPGEINYHLIFVGHFSITYKF